MPRVDRLVVDPEFKVQVRTGGPAGGTDVSQNCASGDRFADLGLYLGEMAIAAGQPVAMVYLDHVAIAAGHAGFDDRAVCRGDDDIAAFTVDVHSGVELI